MICLADRTDHPDLAALHKHLRKLKIKQEAYYTLYYARKDRFTCEPIPFKNAEQYLSTEFLSKDNLRGWFRQNPEEARTWAIDWLKRRRADKALVYPPSQVELESLLCPSMHYYERSGGYGEICRGLGYQIRFDGEFRQEISAPKIVIDTREQRPLAIGDHAIIQTLKCGDYGLEPAFDRGIYIERKSLNDFVGTLSGRRAANGDSALARFTRELDRALEIDAYIIMLVECPLKTVLHFEAEPGLAKVKVNPDHIFKNLRDLLHRFPNFQALFVRDRAEAAQAVSRLLLAGKSVKRVDLQYLYEGGKLI